jgi:streptomycin 3"-adenylyltransferase
MTQYNWTNVSKVIKAEVNTLQSEFQRLLGQKLLGIYLDGSLALGGFQPARSNINVIAVVTEKIDISLKRGLVELLLRISNMPRPLAVYVLAEKDLFPFQLPLSCELHYNEQLREAMQQELRDGNWRNDTTHSDADLTISLAVLQRSGIVLAGKPLQETLPSIPEAAFREALIKSVRTAQAKLPQDPISFILNACRAVAYLQDGNVLSKDDGGEWGLVHLPEQYQALIQQSLALYRGEQLKRPVGRAVLDDFAGSISATITKEHKGPDTGL